MNFPTTTATNHLLPCGLTVILDPNPDHPVLSAQIWIETGSKDEVEHIGSGISHLLEHMVFKGTKSFDCATLAQSVQEKGGHWNAYTSFDRTVYYIDGPSSSSDFFLKTLTELVFHPTLPLEDYETERDVIRREIDMGLDDPDSVASHLLFENAYQHDLRRHPVIGHLDRFNQLTHDDLLNYHKHRYLPSNSFLVLAGDFDSDQVLTELKNLTSDLPNTPTQPLTQPAEPRPIGPRIARKEFPTPISHLTLSWPIPAASHPDIPALEAFAQALGGGRSSALYQRFREQETLCHHISTWAWTPPQGPGIFAISAEVDADRRDQLEATLQAELPALIQSLADEDLQKAIRQIFTTQFRTLTSASGRASDLGSNWHEARNLNLTRDYLQAIAQVTLPQIQAAAQTYLTPDTLTLTSLDPEGRNSPAKANKSKQTTPEFQEHTLSNGLRVLLRHDSRLPTIDLQIAFLAGLPSESPETNGISTLHASTLLLGTEQKSSAEFALALESLGARLRLATGNNTAFLSGYCLADDLPTYLALLGEALTQPLFDPKAISRESQTQLAVIQEAAEDPLKMAFYHLRNAVFGNTHYGLPKLGREETVSTLTTDHLRTHHQDHFTAANAVLALTGDLPPPEHVRTHRGETPAPRPPGHPHHP
ncbi:MAG: pitrilysin family protein, partial [Verrucomicrobiota bacterium]